MSTYNIVSLFCGCGGLDKGFDQVGFNIVASNDVWEAALKTYNHNFDHNAIKGDITEQSIKDEIQTEAVKRLRILKIPLPIVEPLGESEAGRIIACIHTAKNVALQIRTSSMP